MDTQFRGLPACICAFEGEIGMLEAGMEALDFSLSVKEGNQVLLSGFHGMKVILYFCPKDNAPGCAGRRFLRI